ncbi:hypothetical protein [Blastococcus sp. Marseille-P5729]|uniref:hypothetical protein n=1 Tax=Blastococcus sp. Marseille-P5729 TaxID=2086582 RepID=UPI000D107E45|nr:hypothetical protein [Blastococcus sp. Marseille-P5729]
MREEQSKPTIIDEDGKPFIDGDQRAQQPGGIPFGSMPFGSAPFGAMPTPQIPEKYLGRDGKPSLWKILGWKGVAIAVLIIAAVAGLAALSIMVAIIALPILVLIGAVAWVAGRVRGGRPTSSTGRAVIVVRR